MPEKEWCQTNKWKDDSKATGEYFDVLCKAVTEKVCAIVASENAFSILSDGSQARKTTADKEIVLVRVERNGKRFISQLKMNAVKFKTN